MFMQYVECMGRKKNKSIWMKYDIVIVEAQMQTHHNEIIEQD